MKKILVLFLLMFSWLFCDVDYSFEAKKARILTDLKLAEECLELIYYSNEDDLDDDIHEYLESGIEIKFILYDFEENLFVLAIYKQDEM